jgi:hypothetical protein
MPKEVIPSPLVATFRSRRVERVCGTSFSISSPLVGEDTGGGKGDGAWHRLLRPILALMPVGARAG